MTTKLIPLLFSFKGRINRTTFWTFQLIWAVLFALICVLTTPAANADGSPGSSLNIFALVFLLASFWSLFAVQVKRWHDRNKSGWWCFIGLVPAIGGLWVLIECGFLPSVNEGNRFDA